MNRRWIRLWMFLMVVFLSCPLPPPVQAAKPGKTPRAPAAAQTAEKDWPPAELTIGFQTRDSETEGLGDVLVPLWNPGGTGLLFVNPRAAITDQDAEESNLGLGYRQLLPGRGVIVGANGYYDYRDTDARHYDQWGVGFEILSAWLDARANYYDADADAHLVDRRTETTTSQSEQTSAGWSAPYADEHSILQDYTTTRTLTTVTSTRTFEQFEAAYGGYDWEIGLRLPIRSDDFEARVFGGYYDFDREFGRDVQGWKVRTELRVLATLFLDAGLYENADLTGSDWFAGARLSVPLDLAQIARGRNPFATAKSRLHGAPRDLSARLTEMVMRDTQVRLETSDFIENESLATEVTTRERSSDRDSYVLLPDVSFVDGDEGSAAGNGTAERPFATIQQGVDAVFGTRNVYVYDAAFAYVENVVLTPGVSLWGSGVVLPGLFGTRFGSGVAPVVDGGGTGPAITLADRTLVTGFRVQNTGAGGPGVFVNLPVRGLVDVSRVGILGNDATDLTLLANRISGNGTGILLARQGDFRLVFATNAVAGNATDGLEIWTAGNSGTCDVFIADSRFENNGDEGLQIYASTYDQSLVRIQDSQFLDNGGNGLQISQLDTLLAGTGLFNLRAADNAGAGLDLRTQDNALYQGAVTGSTFSANGDAGLSFFSVDAAAALLEIDNSRFADNDGNGLRIEANGGGTGAVFIANGQFEDNGSNGLLLQSADSDRLLLGIEDSDFSRNAENGLGAQVAGGGQFEIVLAGCSLGRNAAAGLDVGASGLDLASVWILDGAFNDNAREGAVFNLFSNDGAILEMFDSQAEGNGFDGIGASLSNLTAAGVVISNVVASQNGQRGVAVAIRDADDAIVAAIALQASSNGAEGLAGEVSEVDDSLIAIQNAAANGNAGPGILTVQTLSEQASVYLSGVQANDNGPNGIGVVQASNDLSQAFVSDGVADDNGGVGLLLAQAGSPLAVAGIAGMQAIENGNAGIGVFQVDNGIGLANVSGSTANDNAGAGVALEQDSLLASIGIVGMPEGFAATADALTALLDLELPEEIDPFLGPFGAVTATGNGARGVQAAVRTDGVLALGGIFDVAASNNAAGGVYSLNEATNGIAAGLAGSSENLAEVFELGTAVAALFDLDLPLSLAGGGHMQVNGNAGPGFEMHTLGDLAAVSAIVGLETAGNAGAGAVVETDSGYLSLAAIARLVSTGNAGNGLQMDVVGTDFAGLGLLADVDASANGENGIVATVESTNGIAALLALSTDALRPAAALLGEGFFDEAIEIPGEPFGPVLASGNAGDGFNATVTGYDIAVAAFLDVQANDNGDTGFDVATASADGMAISAFLSTDVVYDVLPDVLGGDPIAYDPLGGVTANGNGTNGFRIDMDGFDRSILVMAGAEANDNVAGDGLYANLDSADGAVDAYLVNVAANGNAAGRGIDLDLDSEEESRAGLVFVNADGNGQQGIRVRADSGTSDVYALFAGVDAAGNGAVGDLPGLVANLSGAGDAAVAFTDVNSSSNFGRGATAILDAGLDAYLFAGDLAADDLDFVYGYSLDIGPLFDLIPGGPVHFDDNGGNGLHAELTGTNAYLDVNGASANANDTMGYNLTLTALGGNALATVRDATARANGGNGLSLNLDGYGGGASAWLEGVAARDNAANGIHVAENFNGSAPAYVGGEQLVSASNVANGVRLVMSGLGGAPILDFGGGGDSLGQSSFYGNGNRDFRYNNGGGATVMAENNWWGIAPPVNGQFAGSIDRTPWLLADPNAP